MRLLLENLPPSLANQRGALAKCMLAMNRAKPIRAAYLFGSDLTTPARPLCTSLAEVYFTDRYPGFDLADPDWPDFRQKLHAVSGLLDAVKSRLAGPGNP